jgi:hypothetical protein
MVRSGGKETAVGGEWFPCKEVLVRSITEIKELENRFRLAKLAPLQRRF